MSIYAADEGGVYVTCRKLSHDKVDLGFILCLGFDLSTYTGEMLRKVLLQCWPNKLLCIEFWAVGREKEHLERFIVPLHLLAVMRWKIINDEIHLAFDLVLVEQSLERYHKVLPWYDIARRTSHQDWTRGEVGDCAYHRDGLVAASVEFELNGLCRVHPGFLQSVFSGPNARRRLICKDHVLLLEQ